MYQQKVSQSYQTWFSEAVITRSGSAALLGKALKDWTIGITLCVQGWVWAPITGPNSPVTGLMALAPIMIGTRPVDKEKLNIILRIYIMIKTVPVAYLVTSFFFFPIKLKIIVIMISSFLMKTEFSWVVNAIYQTQESRTKDLPFQTTSIYSSLTEKNFWVVLLKITVEFWMAERHSVISSQS